MIDQQQSAALCPDAVVLQRFVQGLVSDEEAGPIENHLEWCSECVKTLSSLQATDPVELQLRGSEAIADQLAPNDYTEGLMLQLRTLPSGSADDNRSSVPLSGAESPDGAGEEYDFLAPADGPEELGRLGPYRVLEVLGSGGMGVVFRAEDTRLGRLVALKVLRPVLAASASARERFRREARSAAGINHDNIVTIYHEGEDLGLPFLAMPLLGGETLEKRLRPRGGLPVAELLRIGGQIAAGLVAAHAHQLVHRDIKPGNIWLEAPADRVKILDFGLARACEGDPGLTRPGSIAGTPHYMSPEQARGEPVTFQSDLFSLGGVLYRMCTGQLPFRGDSTMAVLRSLELDQPRPPREVNPTVPPGLADLIMRLLAKDPAARPAAAQEVIEALREIELDAHAPDTTAIIESSAGGARPPTERFHISRRTLLAAGGAILLGLGGYGLYRRRGPIPDTPETPRALKLSPPDGLRRANIDPYELSIAGGGDHDRAPSELVAVLGDSRLKHWSFLGVTAFSADGQTLYSCDEPDTCKVWDVSTGQLRTQFRCGGLWSPVLSPNGMFLFVRSATQVAMCDISARKVLWTNPIGQSYMGAFHPERPVVAVGCSDRSVHLLDLATGKELRTLQGGACIRFSSDGRTLATVSDKAMTHWDTTDPDVKNWRALQTWDRGSPMEFPVIGPDLRSTLSVKWSLEIRGVNRLLTIEVVDLSTGAVRWRLLGHRTGIRHAAFSADGRLLATAGHDYTVMLWDLSAGVDGSYLAPKRIFRGHTGTVIGVNFSPDGRLLASGSDDRTVRIWDVTTGNQVAANRRGHTAAVCGVAVSPDGNTLATCGYDHLVRLWDLATGLERGDPLRGHTYFVQSAAFSPDGRTLATAGWDHTVRLWDAADGTARSWRGAHAHWVFLVDWSPDGEVLASASVDGVLKLWDPTRPGPAFHEMSFPAGGACVAFSPDFRTLATASDDETVKVWNVTTRQMRGEPLAGRRVAIQPPEGKIIATFHNPSRSIKLWDAVTRKQLDEWVGLGVDATGLIFSPNGQTLVYGDASGKVYVWELGTGGRRRVISLGPYGAIQATAFTPDGRHLVTAHIGGVACVLRLAPPPTE